VGEFVLIAINLGFVLFVGASIYKLLKGDRPSFHYILELLPVSLMTSFSIVLLGIYPICQVIMTALNDGFLHNFSLPLIVGGLIIIIVTLHRYYIFIISASNKKKHKTE